MYEIINEYRRDIEKAMQAAMIQEVALILEHDFGFDELEADEMAADLCESREFKLEAVMQYIAEMAFEEMPEAPEEVEAV